MTAPRDFFEWVHLRLDADYKNARWMGRIFGALSIVFLLFMAVATLLVAGHFLLSLFRAEVSDGASRSEDIRNYGLILVALLGAPLVIWRSVVAAEQSKTAMDALLNDKISSAANGLTARRPVTLIIGENDTPIEEWQDDLVARVAAIDRLEGLVHERPDYAPRIVKLLAIYVRGNFPCTNLDPTESLSIRKIPRMDLQSAISAIGRVLETATQADGSNWRLDLRACDLDGVSFTDGYFRAVDFANSRLEGAIFLNANMEGCQFFGCLLNHGHFRDTNLRGANLDKAIINRPKPVPGGMVDSINFANIEGVSLISADISAIDYLGEPERIRKTFGTRCTVVAREVLRNQLPNDEWVRAKRLLRSSTRRELHDEEKALVEKLKRTGFENWAPYDSADLAVGPMYADFYEDLGLKKWPYWGG